MANILYPRHQTNVIQFTFITLLWVCGGGGRGGAVRSVFIIFHLISFIADFTFCRLNRNYYQWRELQIDTRMASPFVVADRFTVFAATSYPYSVLVRQSTVGCLVWLKINAVDHSMSTRIHESMNHKNNANALSLLRRFCCPGIIILNQKWVDARKKKLHPFVHSTICFLVSFLSASLGSIKYVFCVERHSLGIITKELTSQTALRLAACSFNIDPREHRNTKNINILHLFTHIRLLSFIPFGLLLRIFSYPFI